MERNAHTLDRVLLGDELAFGMACSQGVLSGFAIQGLGDLVHGFGIGLGAGHPLGTHGHGLHGGHVLVSACGDRVYGQVRIGLAQSIGLGAGQRHQLDAGAARCQFGNRASRSAAHKKEGIECAVFELVTGLVGLDVLGLDVAFLHAISGQHNAGIDQGARTWLVQRHALALQVRHRLDTRTLFDHQMDALGIQVGDHAQVGDLGLALIHASAGVRPGGHIRLREPRLQSPAGHAIDVGHGAVGGLGCGHDLAGLADRVGDHAAHGVIGARRAARADAEKLLRLHRCSDGRSQTQNHQQLTTLHDESFFCRSASSQRLKKTQPQVYHILSRLLPQR